MENDNLGDQEILDDDIMQCRADILRSRNRDKEKETLTSNPDTESSTDKTVQDNPVKRSDVVATRVNPFATKKTDESISSSMNTFPAENASDTTRKKVRIPQFEDLVTPEKQVIEGLWETPATDEPITEHAPEETQPIDTDDDVEVGFELDPDNIVTTEEEQALFSDSETEDTKAEEPLTQDESPEEGLEELRRIVNEAKNQAQAEIDELEDIDEIMNNEDVQELAEEKSSVDSEVITDETTETMDVSDLLNSTEDEDDIDVEDIHEDLDEGSKDEHKSDLPDESKSLSEPADNGTMIPKFDLAEKILKEQRQVASKRRQRPAAPRNLNVMPIAGTVGQIIEQAKKAVATAAAKKDFQPKIPPSENLNIPAEEKPAETDRIETEKTHEDHIEPILSVASCRVINESDRLNPFQEDIIIDIVSRDIARFCGEFENV